MRSLPLSIPLPNISLEQALRQLSDAPGFFCLDARGAHPSIARFSIVTALPAHTFSIAGGFVTTDGHTTIDTPFAAFSRFCARTTSFAADPYLPFSGGIAGFIGFEGARALKGLEPARGFSRHSQCRLGLYPAALLFDHLEGTAMVVGNGASRKESQSHAENLCERLDAKHEAYEDAPSPAMAWKSAISLKPSDRVFRMILELARSSIRAEGASRIHIVRHASSPSSHLDPSTFFLSEGAAGGGVRAFFTHEGAAYAATSQETLIEVQDGKLRAMQGFPDATSPVHRREIASEFCRILTEMCRASADALRDAPDGIERRCCFQGELHHSLLPIEALVGLLPSPALTGTPFAPAMTFISRHEDLHRHLYGGAFGIMDARTLRFHGIEKVRICADQAISTIAGIDCHADTDAASVACQMQSGFSGEEALWRSMPR